jgi:hypothetical protein
MKRRSQRLIHLVVAIASVLIAWWLLDLAGAWSRGPHYVAQFLCFVFCVNGIERIASAAADMAVIVFERSDGNTRVT